MYDAYNIQIDLGQLTSTAELLRTLGRIATLGRLPRANC